MLDWGILFRQLLFFCSDMIVTLVLGNLLFYLVGSDGGLSKFGEAEYVWENLCIMIYPVSQGNGKRVFIGTIIYV